MRLMTSLAVLCTAAACTSNVDAPEDLETTTDDLRARLIEVELSGLEPVGPDYIYEGWVILHGRPYSTGRFESSGPIMVHSFATSTYVRRRASAFVLTIEPVHNDDPAPSATHILAGDLRRGSGSLSIAHGAALGSDFTDASGGFILATPTTQNGTEDDNNGIWYLDPSGPAPALNLPTLPEGWVYEGWVVGEDGPVSTGRFSSVTGADEDGAGATAGPAGSPPFPGQDFITPPRNLLGMAAVITIEPQPDTSAAPFTMKPLITPSIEDVGSRALQAMQNRALDSNPSGTVRSAAGAAQVLSMYLDGLTELGSDYVYEGWLIVDGAPKSTGRFDVVEGYSLYQFFVKRNDARRASTFVLTIEPRLGDDPAPAATHVLAGNLNRRKSGYITIEHPAALATDFHTAAGEFILETPTTRNRPGDFNQGIWYLDPTGPAPTLELPTLPEGWTYEGWVVGPDGPVSTGRFLSTTGADQDGAGPTAGPDGSPPFPGQDFIDPALVLSAGYAAVITVEPEPDNSPAPFVMKPLVDSSIEDVGPAVLQSMENRSAQTNPYGWVSVRRFSY